MGAGCGCGASTKNDVKDAKNDDKGKGGKTEEIPDAKNMEDIRDKYELGKTLGSGSFGQVREAKLKDVLECQMSRAVKIIERDNGEGEWSNQAIFVREVGLLQQIKHDNIIRYYDFYEDPHFLYVVMELCTGGEVFAKIVELKRFTEKQAAIIGQQMLRAMDYIHKLSIAHRDIKAENFMLSEPSISSNVKMIDFGMAIKFKPDQVLTELCGSPHYLAPELIGQKYNHFADVWAFGILLYLLMYGHYPYDAKHPRDIMVKILTEPIQWQTKAKLSRDATEFLKQLLEHNPKKRLSAGAALGHTWMKLADKPQEKDTSSESLLSPETVRSAHKRITATRKAVDPSIDRLRNEKLKKIEDDFTKGVRHGKRLGETPQEEFMSKPEFVRRENKITTAPSRDLNNRRESLSNMVKNVFVRTGEKKKTGELETMTEETVEEEGEKKQLPALDRKFNRSQSLTSPPRRLSYIGNITKQEEGKLASLYEERKTAKQQLKESQQLSGVVPTEASKNMPQALPGTSEEVEDDDESKSLK